MRQNGRHAVREHFSRGLDVARTFGNSATDEDDAVRADRGCFVDHALVVVDRRLPARGIGGRKQPAAAIAGHLDAILLYHASRFIETRRLDVVTPWCNRRDSVFEARLDAVLEGAL